MEVTPRSVENLLRPTISCNHFTARWWNILIRAFLGMDWLIPWPPHLPNLLLLCYVNDIVYIKPIPGSLTLKICTTDIWVWRSHWETKYHSNILSLLMPMVLESVI